MKYKIIALIGKAGSGKDTLMKEILKNYSNTHEIVSCTTRPCRDYEVDGVNYFYLSNEQFGNKVANGDMLECTYFNGWHYGTSKDSVNENMINVGVFNPAGIRSLKDNPLVDLRIFYITAGDKTRLLRQLNRETFPNVDEIVRRYETDRIDFKNIYEEFEPCCIGNDNGNSPTINAMKIAVQCADWLDEVNPI